MDGRRSDIGIIDAICILLVTQAAHLLGCLFSIPFHTVCVVLAAGVVVVLLAGVIACVWWGRRNFGGGDTAVASRRNRQGSFRAGCETSSADGNAVASPKAGCETSSAEENAAASVQGKQVEAALYVVFIGIVLWQLYGICFSGKYWLAGDMTMETVQSFLTTDAIYSVNPLTGAVYTQALPLRLRILSLPTLYAAICRLTGLSVSTVVLKLVPAVVLLLSYVVYGLLAQILCSAEDAPMRSRRKRILFLIAVALLYSCGTYLVGMDGYGALYGAFRGTSIRAMILLPYCFACLLRRRPFGVALCIVAEACIVYTYYGAGYCLLVTVGYVVAVTLSRCIRRRQTPQDEAPCMAGTSGTGAVVNRAEGAKGAVRDSAVKTVHETKEARAGEERAR